MIELVVALGVGGVIILTSSTLLHSLYQEKKRAEFLLAVTELRLTLQNAITRSQDWQTTQMNNPAMACFSGGAPASCSSLSGVAPQDFRVYSTGTLLYDSSNANSGYTMTGVPCSTYGTTADCVLKPRIRWHVECNTAVDPTCHSPLVVVELDYDYNGTGVGAINFASYGFRISKSTFPLQITNPCGGVVPACTASQAAICESGSWVCREFGL